MVGTVVGVGVGVIVGVAVGVVVGVNAGVTVGVNAGVGVGVGKMRGSGKMINGASGSTLLLQITAVPGPSEQSDVGDESEEGVGVISISGIGVGVGVGISSTQGFVGLLSRSPNNSNTPQLPIPVNKKLNRIIPK